MCKELYGVLETYCAVLETAAEGTTKFIQHMEYVCLNLVALINRLKNFIMS